MFTKKSLLAILVILNLLLIGGCSTDSMENLDTRAHAKVEKEISVVKPPLSKRGKILGRHFSINMKKVPVYIAVKRVCKQLKLPLDDSFAPSKKYRVTANFEGTLRDFFRVLRNQSGVEYSYTDGLVKVVNRNLVDAQHQEKVCKEDESSVKIALKGVPVNTIFKYFASNFNYSFSYDMKYLNADQDKQNKKERRRKTTSFFYSGCDPMEALVRLAESNDLRLSNDGNKKITVSDYAEESFDVPVYFNTKFRSIGTGIGGASANSEVSNKENTIQEFQKFIESRLSPLGKVYMSQRGYLSVVDRPSYIKHIRALVNKESRMQENISIGINIIRVDISNGFESGIDWSGVFGNYFGIGINSTSSTGGGASFSFNKGSKSILLTMLEQYGDAKIVKSYTLKGRSGILSTFRAIEKIPYMVTSVVYNDGQKEVTTTEKSAEAGIIVNIIPTFSKSGKVVNLSTDITLSEYLGDKEFSISGNTYKLPKISSNKIQMPASVRIGNSLAITGLRLKGYSDESNGVPGSKDNKLVSTLFGNKKDRSFASEFVIVLTPQVVN